MVVKPFGWVAIVAIVGSMACPANRTSNEVGLATAEAAPTVTVQNDNWLDVAVYVVHGTSRLRIGTVSSTSRQTFKLPREGATGAIPLQILADPIGENRRYITEPVTLAPGQRLEVRVGSPISISSFAIWNR